MSAQSLRITHEKWKVITDDGVIYLTPAANNRPARAVELEHGIVLRFAEDNGEFLGLTLLFPEDLTYEAVRRTAGEG